jgi:hypothetical protein
MADAPSYNCGDNVAAAPSSDGTHYTFNVVSLASDDALAVAILPTSPVDRVVLSAPNDSSLAVRPTNVPASSAAPSSGATSSGSDGTIGRTGSTSSSGGGDATQSPSGALPPTAPTVSAPPLQQQTPQVATAPQSNYQPSGIPTAAALTPARANPHTVIVLIAALLLGVVLWQMVGRAAVAAALRDSPEAEAP